MMMLPDAVEVLHKASQSCSSLISCSPKADVGSVSLKVPIKADVEGKMIEEMRTNALVMNKARLFLSLLVRQEKNRTIVSLPRSMRYLR
jgi:hypothetical protein